MARNITVSIPHELHQAEVKRRLTEALSEARLKHGDLLRDTHESWPSEHQMDFTARALGQAIRGSIQIDPTQVHLTVHLPMLLATFASKIESQIQNTGLRLLKK
jgi:Putative polyhydroxyalkanoic acid system protein (PHA_gran_rgn)